ncbi:tyrosine-type recombinase/integrase [Hymenobacter perfusus]|uniref:Site-specific integrase n=1 Tax=Hymenobacter perfusus TaxID=1236770 RepID=A0A428JWA5_9BACT|nr:site-specific integrase [Hymenobacter perfusus]RSK38443.1 site-specific integrase [Hymenobacter perfusus]
MEELYSRFPALKGHPHVACWLQIITHEGLSRNTVLKYAHILANYLRHCQQHPVDHLLATREHTALYQHSLGKKTWRKGHITRTGLSKSTIRQHLVVLKLYYTYLVEAGERTTIPLRRSVSPHCTHPYYTSGISEAQTCEAWIPDAQEWAALSARMQKSSLRNLLMLRLAYDGALRREEVCSLQVGDLDHANLLLTVRRETTKNKLQRSVPFSRETKMLYDAYLAVRPVPLHPREPLFVSESRRNAGQPISIWSWSKIVRAVGLRSGLPQFRTHTMRHLRLTHLAEAGVDVYTIAKMAGHKHVQTTMGYLHVRSDQLAAKMLAAMRALDGPSATPLT